ncbi:MAG: ribosomal protein S18 acetylase RimI-like enzyme [Neolewinella sp.]|jgi:ribosomal protein S18 acetylase RimI-like enzyme
MELRTATPNDAPAIAALHARNWQIAYRGDFPAHYLDVECPVERLDVWTKRFANSDPNMLTTIAEKTGKMVGFCCTFQAQDEHGSYLDNLHVTPEMRGQGLGKILMRDAAKLVNTDEIYLFVITTNSSAIGFYEHLGGRLGKTKTINLAGTELEVVSIHWESAKLAAIQ